MKMKYRLWRNALYEQMPEGEWTTDAIMTMDILNCRGRPYSFSMIPKNVYSCAYALKNDRRFEGRRKNKNSAYVWSRRGVEE